MLLGSQRPKYSRQNVFHMRKFDPMIPTQNALTAIIWVLDNYLASVREVSKSITVVDTQKKIGNMGQILDNAWWLSVTRIFVATFASYGFGESQLTRKEH